MQDISKTNKNLSIYSLHRFVPFKEGILLCFRVNFQPLTKLSCEIFYSHIRKLN